MDIKNWVDIIIPLYNCEKTIGRLLTCIESQDYKYIRIILIDDCSKDNTESVVKEYIKHTERVIYYEKMEQNGGISNARNRGLDLSNSEYMMFMDNDDELSSTSVVTYLMENMKHNNNDLIIGDFRGVYKEGKEPLTKKIKDKLKSKKTKKIGYVIDKPELIAECDTMVWSKMYKRSFIGSQRFNLELVTSEDLYFINELLLRNPKVQVLDYVMYDYWLENTQSFSKQFHQSDSFFLAFNLLMENENYHKYEDEINFVIVKNITLEYLQRILKFETLDILIAKNYINDMVKKIGLNKLEKNKYINSQSFILRFMMKKMIKNSATMWFFIKLMKK